MCMSVCCSLSEETVIVIIFIISILIVVRARVTRARVRVSRQSRLASQGPRLAAGHAASCRGKAARGKAAYNLVIIIITIMIIIQKVETSDCHIKLQVHLTNLRKLCVSRLAHTRHVQGH